MNTTRITPFVGRAASLTLALASLAGTAAHAQVAPTPAPTKVYDSSNQLIGLNGVTVGSGQFDVRFIGGKSCQDIFSGCDSASDFTFQSKASAQSASAEILDALNQSDFPGNGPSVNVFTPYGLDTSATLSVSLQGASYMYNTIEFTSNGMATVSSALASSDYYAVWTASVSAVPEPGSWALMAAGLGAVGWMARRRRNA